MDADTLRNDPRTRKAEEFITELRAVYMKYGVRPTEIHVNPGDDFLTRFQKIKGMKVVKDHNVGLGTLALT